MTEDTEHRGGGASGGGAGTQWVTDAFEATRPRLHAVAYRMLGSAADADDAVQEAWLRLHRADPTDIENFQGWLTTVVARICLDALRSRRTRGEASLPDPAETRPAGGPGAVAEEPDRDLLLADSIGPALMILLDRLTPAERLAFVLHDLFAVPFEEIAPIVGRSPAAARQLASRARRRVQGTGTAEPEGTGEEAAHGDAEGGRLAAAARGTVAAAGAGRVARARQQRVVDAFLAAARGDDFGTLLTLLDPEVVLRADRVAVDMATRRATVAARVAAAAGAEGAGGRGAPRLSDELRGPDAVARLFAGWAQGAQPAVVDGVPGLVWAPGGRPRSVFVVRYREDRIVAIDIVADPTSIEAMELSF